MPAVLNAANEVAVEAFCSRQISFLQIFRTVEDTMRRHQLITHPTLAQILEADASARKEAEGLVAAHSAGR